jgi:hypothetical protein
MKRYLLAVLFVVVRIVSAQSNADPIVEAESAFGRVSTEKGMKQAFLGVLSDDSVVFRPGPMNGKEFWRSYNEDQSLVLVRQPVDFDISSNGMLGFSTGNWRLFPKGKGDETAEYGEYATIWEKRGQGFFATVEIRTTHDKLTFSETDQKTFGSKTSDANRKGWSVADASMNFLRASMSKDGLSGAYKAFASDGVRLLIEREPPIIGKKDAVKAMRLYTSIAFPVKINLLQAADMAYTWYPCQYSNSGEGTESGNCLQVWKLRGKDWSIVLSVYSRVSNETKPALKFKPKDKKHS